MQAGGARLTLPRPGGGERTLGLGAGDAFCNSPRWLATHAGGALLRVEVDDVSSADPRPLRLVVAGLLGTGVRSAQLLGAGGPRDLDLGGALARRTQVLPLREPHRRRAHRLHRRP